MRSTNWKSALIGPLHDPVTWYGIINAGTQITQWDSGTVRQWDSGTVGQWDSGTVGQWDSGTVGQWDSGTVGQWDSGTVGQWDSGTVGQWDSGTVGQWDSGTVGQWDSGAVGQWDSGTVGQWDSGTVGQWDSGTVGQWDSGTVGQWDSGTVGQWDSGTVGQWENKGTLTSPAQLFFVLKVPKSYFRFSIICSVPWDRIIQRPIIWAHITTFCILDFCAGSTSKITNRNLQRTSPGFLTTSLYNYATRKHITRSPFYHFERYSAFNGLTWAKERKNSWSELRPRLGSVRSWSFSASHLW